MECEQVEHLIMDLISGELSLEIAKMMEEHLKSCTRCMKSYDETTEIIELMKRASPELEVDSASKSTLKETLLQELRINRATSPFLAALHHRKEEIKKRIISPVKDRKSGSK